MRVSHTVFRTPKADSQPSENEDAADIEPKGFRARRFAVADGATDGFRSKPWAKLLVASNVRGHLDVLDPDSIAAIQHPFARQLSAEIAAGRFEWFAEIKAQRGAFAALVTLELLEGPQKEWQAVAVGDSCLFQIRRDRLLKSFPLMKSEEFGCTPFLIGSNTDPCEVVRQARLDYGTWEEGDEFFLMTDALADWFLRQAELEKQPWQTLRSDRVVGDFAGWVRELRATKQIRNDDTTLLRVQLWNHLFGVSALAGVDPARDWEPRPDQLARLTAQVAKIPTIYQQEGLDRGMANSPSVSGSDAKPDDGFSGCGTEDWPPY